MASLSTTAATNITANSAVVGGNITDDGGGAISERGICYSNTTSSPTITNYPKVIIGSGIGLFSSTITGLTMNSTYYVRAYAINSAGTSYGVYITFVTSGSPPTVSTKDVSNILETSAIAGGIVLTDEGASVTERGVCYSTTTNPTIYDTKIASGSGTGGFNVPLNTLIPNTTYYVRAYATNKNGTAYGENKSFKTADAYYEGFENGWPTGWTGNWSITPDSPYERFNCFKSTASGQTIELTRTITTGGNISFWHRADGEWTSSYPIKTEFYIDDVLKETIYDEEWTIHSFSATAGDHKFKWINKGGGYYNNNTYIDYVICPK